jgi:hypothetical protein
LVTSIQKLVEFTNLWKWRRLRRPELKTRCFRSAAAIEEPALPHLDPTLFTQALLTGSILVLTAVAPVRGGLFFRNSDGRPPRRYPGAWTAEQIKMFGRLRLAIGGCLAITWLTFLVTASRAPVSRPFGFEASLLTIVLLLLTGGWLMLLVRSNWENSLLNKCRFRTGFVIVALGWIAVLAAIFATIGWTTAPHVHVVFPRGTIV